MRKQIVELTQRMAVRDLENHEELDQGSRSLFENPYHCNPRGRDFCVRDDYRGGLGFKVEIPSFSGTLHTDDFIDWLNEVDRIFEYKEVPDHDKVKLVAIKLQGRACAWWKQMQRSREKKGKPKVNDWEKIREFAYNRSMNRTTGLSPFQVVLGQNPSGVLDLTPIPRVGHIHPKAEEMTEHLVSVHDQNPSGVLDLTPIPRVGHIHPKAEEMTEHLVSVHDQIHSSSFAEHVVVFATRSELHNKGNFGWDKTLALVSAVFYWPRDVTHFVDSCYNPSGVLDLTPIPRVGHIHPKAEEMTEHLVSVHDQVVLGQNPSGVMDLTPIPRVGHIHPKAEEMTEHLVSVHDQVICKIEESNKKYKARVEKHRRQVLFDVGDFVRAVLTKDRFPVGEYEKLKEQKIGPYEIVQMINDNVYRLRLPSHLKMSDVFHVKHLTPCFADSEEDDVNSRASSLQPGETDSSKDPNGATTLALVFHEKHD
ncbi:unnamed protein product [Cuscuta campestris]|uniref:Tf2-1-like SH3-like domain-containing protein n=1 Tax=Cuscuta campestris TaxID=132261 RepID=A0A484LUB8_9ASTE|nr:unnamed protein product [Cuscuta campestris]